MCAFLRRFFCARIGRTTYMARQKKRGPGRPPKKQKNDSENRSGWFLLEHEVAGSIIGIILLAIAIVITLGFFGASGPLSDTIVRGCTFLFGKGAFLFPLMLFVTALYIVLSHKPQVVGSSLLGSALLLFSILGIVAIAGNGEQRLGGWIGYLVSLPFERSIGAIGATVILVAVFISGILVIFRLPVRSYARELIVPTGEDEEGNKVYGKKIVEERGLIETMAGVAGKIRPKTKVAPPPRADETVTVNQPGSPGNAWGEQPDERRKTGGGAPAAFSIIPVAKNYKFPPIDLLEDESGSPVSGDIKENALIIQKTLENFGIPVEMSEVNIGPSVKQFTF